MKRRHGRLVSKSKLLLINYEFDPIGGGAASASLQYAELLAKRGYELTVVTSSFKNLPKEEDRKGYRIIRVPALRQHEHKSNLLEMLSFIISACLSLGKIIKEVEPNHALVFFVSPFGSIGYILKTFYSIPYSVFARGGDIPDFVPSLSLYHFLLAPLTSLVLTNASNIFTNGMYLKELTEKLTDKEVVNIPNGLDSRKFKPKEKQTEVLKLLFVGRIVDYQKNVFKLIEIMHHLKNRIGDFNVKLDIVGEGPDLVKLKQASSKFGLDTRIKFYDWLNKAQLQEKYNESDILVLPSSYEGVSNVLVEAIASGLFVISNDIPDSRYFIEKTNRGVLIAENKVEDYINIIKQIYKDRSLIKIHDLDKFEADLQELSWDSSVDKMLLSLEGVR